MHNSSRPLAGLLGTVAIAALAVGTADAQSGRLFTGQGAAEASAKAHVAQAKRVGIDRRALRAPRLTLDLFGIEVMAVRTKIEQRRGETVWVGHVEGNPLETVVITARGRAFAGVVHHGGETYELTGDGRGEVVLERLDLGALPQEDLEGLPDGGAAYGVLSGDAAAAGDAVRQDLLVVYTQAACVEVGGANDTGCDQIQANIATAVADMNAAYAASGVGIASNLVGTAVTGWNEAGTGASATLTALRSTSDGAMDEVHPLRDALGADIVALIYTGPGCGIGYVGSNAGSAFSVTAQECMVGNRTMAHEIGHNQGALHDRKQHAGGDLGAYNYGFRRCADGSDEDRGAPYFRTVMAYGCAGAPRVGRFSNPDATYSGVPQGLDPAVDPAKGAFNARTLNESAAYMAAFRDAPSNPVPPAAPSGLSANAEGPDRVALVWSDNATAEDGFEVERSSGGSAWAIVASLGANAEGFVDTGLAAQTAYAYRVRAVNGAGASGWTNAASATTGAAPSEVVATASGQTPVQGTVTGALSATFSDDGQVQRLDEVGTGGPRRRRQQSYEHRWSFDVTGGAGGVVFAANAWVSGAEAARFDYSADGGASWSPMFTLSETGQDTTKSFVFPGSTEGLVLVRATDAGGVDAEPVDNLFVDAMTVTSATEAGSPPAAPSALSVTGTTATSVALRFTDNAEDEFGFELRRAGAAPAGCAAGAVVGTLGANPGTGTLAATDGTAAPGTTYWYWAAAFNGAGDGGACSNAVSATTDAAPAISASAAGSKRKGLQVVDLRWSGAQGPSVDIRRDGALVATTPNDGAYRDDLGVKGGGTYRYEVCEAGTAAACSEGVTVAF